MRAIERTTQFKRDYRRERAATRRTNLERDLATLVTLLATDTAIPARHVDHALSGKFRGLRDSHLYPDLVLLYEKPDPNTLRLVRLGSHSELGL